MPAEAGNLRSTVVVVDEEFPWPANSGKRIRTLALTGRLARDFNIIYVAHQNADSVECVAARQHLATLGIRTIEVPHRVQAKSGSRFYLKLAANLLSNLPYTVTSHASPAMREQLGKLRREMQVDVWHCEWTPYAELFRNLDANPLVLSAHNVESLIWRRYAETERGWLKRWFIRRQLHRFEKFERWAFSRAAQTIMVSDDDALLARESFGATQTRVVANGVDADRYRANGHVRQASQMIFVGSLDWRPNLDGIRQFLETSFPGIVEQEPSARLTIVGRNPPTWLIDRAKNDRCIELYANVPDVVPYLSQAGVMIVPLRIGGGSRLKIIEAAANHLPVVSTRVGAEGLKFCPGRDYLAADSIEAMSEPVLRAIREPETRRRLADSARLLVEREYQWDALAMRQSEIWRTAASQQ